jgi:hypothetical protein
MEEEKLESVVRSLKVSEPNAIARVEHEANLELMIVDSQKRARFHIKDIGNEHLTLEMSRITATIPGLDLDRWNSGEGKISGKLTLSLDIDY